MRPMCVEAEPVASASEEGDAPGNVYPERGGTSHVGGATVLTYIAAFLVLAAVLTLVVGAFLVQDQRTDYSLPNVVQRLLDVVAQHPKPILVLALVAVVHHLAVHFLDPLAAQWVRNATGIEFTKLVLLIEGDLVRQAVSYHWEPLTTVLVYFYLVFHAFMIFFAPAFVVVTEQGRNVRTALLLYPVVYLLALPFLLFFPVPNPQVYFGLPSALELVIPGVEAIFYTFTTVDNTLPSLHVAMASAIALLSYRCSGNRRFRGLSLLYAVLVALTVVYLPIHWLLDVAGGVLVGFAGFHIAHHLAGHESMEATDETRERVRNALADKLGVWRRE